MDAANAQTAADSIDALDIESAFTAHYRRIARMIALVIGNHGRAEELAVDVFLKWVQSSAANSNPEGWLYRAAANLAIDELRKHRRRNRFDWLFESVREPATPEQLHSASQERGQVRTILATMQRRQAELLVLRTQGFSYEELATTLGLHRASIGTLLKRAEQTFRKEYIAKYGPQ